MLAFAFLATFGFNGLVTLFLHDRLGVDTFAWGGWIYELPGLVVVYTYFQIPLMVIVFLPALDGLRPQWREACESLGGSAWTYWRYVGFPILWPVLPGRHAAAVRQRLLGLRHGQGPDLAGEPARPAADRHLPHERGRPRPGQPRQGAGVRHDPGRRGDHDGLRDAAEEDRRDGCDERRRAAARLGAGALRWAVLLSIGAFMLLPLAAMLEFSTRGIGGGRSLEPWLAIGANPDLLAAIWVSLKLAALTVVGMLVLLLPTMVWVQLRRAGPAAPGRVRLPAAADHPGDRAGRRARPGLSRGSPTCSANPRNTLTFVYVVLVLPFAYRSLATGLAAIDLVTLAEAGAQPRLLLVRRDLADRRAQHHGRDHVRGADLGRAGAGRVHDLVAPELRDPAGGDQPARQARRRASRSRSRSPPCSWRRRFCSCCPSSTRAGGRRVRAVDE